jgi:hypothetical protein
VSVVVFALLGIGLGSAFSPLLHAVLSHVPMSNATDASGVVATCQQLAFAIGVAVFGSVYLSLAAHGHSTIARDSGHGIGVTLLLLAVAALVGAILGLLLTRRQAR